MCISHAIYCKQIKDPEIINIDKNSKVTAKLRIMFMYQVGYVGTVLFLCSIKRSKQWGYYDKLQASCFHQLNLYSLVNCCCCCWKIRGRAEAIFVHIWGWNHNKGHRLWNNHVISILSVIKTSGISMHVGYKTTNVLAISDIILS